MKLIAIGDTVVDYYQDQGKIYPGGNALNVAVAAKRSGAESSAFLGITGDDAAAAQVLHSMESEGIDRSRIRRVYGPHGEAVVTLSEDGDRIFVGTNRGHRVSSLLRLQLTDDDLAYISQFDVIHSSVNSDLEHELARLAQQPLSFDFSIKKRWDDDYLQQLCPYLTYAFFSGSDMSITEIEELTSRVHSLGVKVVGVTRGSEAARFSDEGMLYEQLPLRVDIVDTMGAGDSFIGAFLAAYHGTWNMQTALGHAAIAASKTCKQYGAFGYGAPKK
ncbi:PfkB family carbohydrate kinase [Paenibacillus sp. 1P07SE]|uniref:PfkB family carbohydrate kinase n=1 Tax=Paenibacillus sp. 1P07SE TaxID=3132209 RepID=UPI0039A6BFCE